MPELGEPLSERELDVLKCLAQGASNHEIALDLSISPNTVKVHLRRIYAKLGVSSRTEAVRAAMEQGIQLLPDVTVASGDSSVTGVTESHTDAAAAQEPAAAQDVSADAAVDSALRRGGRWRTVLWVVGLVLAIVVLLVAWQELTPSAPTRVPPEPTRQFGGSRWFSSQSMPAPASGMAVAAIGLDLIQISGETDAGIVNNVRLYDTKANTWRELAPKPTAVTEAGAAVLGGEIFVVGGRLADDQPSGVVEAYSPSNNAWRQVEPLPTPVAGALAMSDGSLLYVFGGWDGSAATTQALAYDPGSDSWQTLEPMPTPSAYAAGGVIRGLFYVVGGWNGADELALCHSFEPAAELWDACPPMRQPRRSAGAAVLVNRLYVVGGSEVGEVGPAEVLDPAAGTWEAVEVPMLGEAVAWTLPAMVVVESDIFLLGGRLDETLSAAVYRFSPLENKIYLPAAPVGGNP